MNTEQQQTQPQQAETETTEQDSEFQKLVRKQEIGPRGLELTTMDSLFRFAREVFNSGLAPSSFKNESAVLVAMEMGAELGLRPMMAIQTIAVINNRPCIWGDGLWAIVQASPLFDQDALEELMSVDNEQARCTVARVGGKPITRCFSLDDAKTAGLLGKDNWKKYPKRMLQMRARMWACRDAFPDVMCGIRTVEEVVDDELGDTTAASAQDHIDKFKAERASMPSAREFVTDGEADKQRVDTLLDSAREAGRGHAQRAEESALEDGAPLPNPPTPDREAAIDTELDKLVVRTNPPPNPPTPEEVEAYSPTEDQIATGRAIIARIEKCVSFANFDQVEADAVNLSNEGRLSQTDCVEISEMIANGRAGLKT